MHLWQKVSCLSFFWMRVIKYKAPLNNNFTFINHRFKKRQALFSQNFRWFFIKQLRHICLIWHIKIKLWWHLKNILLIILPASYILTDIWKGKNWKNINYIFMNSSQSYCVNSELINCFRNSGRQKEENVLLLFF